MTLISAIRPIGIWDSSPIGKSRKTHNKWALPKIEDSFVYNILTTKINIEKVLIQYQNSRVNGEQTEIDYDQYLQFPNSNIKALADRIVSVSDTDDEKIYKIEQWVQNNITYKADIKNYGQMEYWALPTLTVNRKTGRSNLYLTGFLLMLEPEAILLN